MLALLLVCTSTLLDEIASSLGKDTVVRRLQSVYTMGFVQMFFTVVFLAGIIIIRPDSFVFSLASLPTFIPRLVLEIIQAHVMVLGIVRADRSTYGFIRVITIPLLLGVDVVLGYTIPSLQIIGMAVMIVALLIAFANHGIQRAGAGLVLFGGLNAVITLSLYKYDISHFNSVAAEQIFIFMAVLLYFFLTALFLGKENPLFILKKPPFFLQSFTEAIGGVLESFAYQFAPASIVVAAKRSSAVLWSIISGNRYFKEKKILFKLGLFIIISAGIVLLVK